MRLGGYIPTRLTTPMVATLATSLDRISGATTTQTYSTLSAGSCLPVNVT